MLFDPAAHHAGNKTKIFPHDTSTMFAGHLWLHKPVTIFHRHPLLSILVEVGISKVRAKTEYFAELTLLLVFSMT